MINISIKKNKLDFNFFKAIVIAKESGEHLLDYIFDSDINPIMLSSFVGALGLFGKDNLVKIEEINIKGLDIDMIIVYKYKLILVAITDKNLTKGNLREEAEKSLDWFYILYEKEIENAINLDVFDSFKKILYLQIKEYLEKINSMEKEKETIDLGFYTENMHKLKNNSD